MTDLQTILKTAVAAGAGEIHLRPDNPPMMRLDAGPVQAIPGLPILTAGQAKELIYSAIYDEQRTAFEAKLAFECGFAIKGVSRFHMRMLAAADGVQAVIRVVP